MPIHEPAEPAARKRFRCRPAETNLEMILLWFPDANVNLRPLHIGVYELAAPVTSRSVSQRDWGNLPSTVSEQPEYNVQGSASSNIDAVETHAKKLQTINMGRCQHSLKSVRTSRLLTKNFLLYAICVLHGVSLDLS